MAEVVRQPDLLRPRQPLGGEPLVGDQEVPQEGFAVGDQVVRRGDATADHRQPPARHHLPEVGGVARVVGEPLEEADLADRPPVVAEAVDQVVGLLQDAVGRLWGHGGGVEVRPVAHRRRGAGDVVREDVEPIPVHVRRLGEDEDALSVVGDAELPADLLLDRAQGHEGSLPRVRGTPLGRSRHFVFLVDEVTYLARNDSGSDGFRLPRHTLFVQIEAPHVLTVRCSYSS